MELLAEKLGDLDCCEDRGEQEDHSVRARWYHDTRVLGQSQRRDELHRGDRGRIDAAELEVRFLEGCEASYSMLNIVVTDKACLGTEE